MAHLGELCFLLYSGWNTKCLHLYIEGQDTIVAGPSCTYHAQNLSSLISGTDSWEDTVYVRVHQETTCSSTQGTHSYKYKLSVCGTSSSL